MTSKMNDCEKAKAVISDRNVSLIEISRKYKIPYQTLKNWRANPDKLKKAHWERVFLLANLYHKRSTTSKMNDFKKAKAFISDRNIRLIEVYRKYKIPYQTLKNWRVNPDKLKKASWERVFLLANLYHKKV